MTTSKHEEIATLLARIYPRDDSSYHRRVGLVREIKQSTCPRVMQRMECPECEYPFSEALLPLDTKVPHYEQKDFIQDEDPGDENDSHKK